MPKGEKYLFLSAAIRFSLNGQNTVSSLKQHRKAAGLPCFPRKIKVSMYHKNNF